jgi:predicted amidohydrolase
MAPELGRPEETLARLGDLITDIGEVDLLVLPELCNSGYRFESEEQARELSEEVGQGSFSQFLADRCRGLDCHIVSGINERDGDRLYNTAVLMGPDGVVGIYRKLHLFVDEKDFFAPGNAGLPVFDIGPCRVGMQVCFDWVFPETWRVLALKGADVIAHPSNLVLPGFCQQAVPVHALVNRVFVVTANRIGRERDLQFTGTSVIADPRGRVLAEGPPDREEVRVEEIDVGAARDKAVTPRNDIFHDRRPEEYRLLTETDRSQSE